MTTQEVIKLIHFVKSEDLPLVIECDATPYHIAWGSSDINTISESLLDYPPFVTNLRQEVIDITVFTRNLISKAN